MQLTGFHHLTAVTADAARNAEFVAFEDAIARHPGLRDRILVIPGNHDVNIVDRANPSRLELPTAPGGSLRRLRFLSCMARLQGGRVRVVSHGTGRVGPTLDVAQPLELAEEVVEGLFADTETCGQLGGPRTVGARILEDRQVRHVEVGVSLLVESLEHASAHRFPRSPQEGADQRGPGRGLPSSKVT